MKGQPTPGTAGPTLEAGLGEATETMLGQTLAAARRVGADGHVLAADISSNILAFAERSAREAGLSNGETRVLDGEQLDGRAQLPAPARGQAGPFSLGAPA